MACKERLWKDQKVLRLFITAINLAVKCQNVGVRDNTWWSWLRLLFMIGTTKTSYRPWGDSVSPLPKGIEPHKTQAQLTRLG